MWTVMNSSICRLPFLLLSLPIGDLAPKQPSKKKKSKSSSTVSREDLKAFLSVVTDYKAKGELPGRHAPLFFALLGAAHPSAVVSFSRCYSEICLIEYSYLIYHSRLTGPSAFNEKLFRRQHNLPQTRFGCLAVMFLCSSI